MGTTTVDGPDPDGFNRQLTQPFVAQRQGSQIQSESREVDGNGRATPKTETVLIAQLKEQAAQIQKVSAHIEMSEPATKVVANSWS